MANEQLPYLAPPYVAAEVARIEDALLRTCPSRQWEIRTLTFPTTAGQPLDIAHGLAPSRPEFIDWLVIQAMQPCVVYQPVNVPFTDGVVHLCCTQPGGVVTLLLMVTAALPGRAPLLGAALDATATGAQIPQMAVGGEIGYVSLIGQIGTSGSGELGPGVVFNVNGAGGNSDRIWSIIFSDDSNGCELSFGDQTADLAVVNLRRVSADGHYALIPGDTANGSVGVDLGTTTTNEQWRAVYADTITADLGYLERGRSVALGVQQTLAYADSNFLGNINGNADWVVDDADEVITYAYHGTQVTVNIAVFTSTIANAPTQLIVTGLPTIAVRTDSRGTVGNGGVQTPVIFTAAAGAGSILISKDDGSAFTNETNTTYVVGQITYWV